MKSVMACPKCNGPLEEGFTFDQTQGTVFVSSWVEGAPEKSFLGGTKIEGKRRFYIVAYRCKQCGYLEFYARDEVK